MLFPSCAKLVEESRKIRMKKRAIVLRSRNLIFNLKLLPFLNLENARNFYITAKEYFSDDEFANFHKYFGNTWMNLEDNEYVKFNSSLWSYKGKFEFINSRNNNLISKGSLDEYIFLSNNCCESVNNLINNFIQVNSKVGIDRFETIIKTLFIRLECIRTNNNQMGERFINKKVLYDIPMDIIRKGF